MENTTLGAAVSIGGMILVAFLSGGATIAGLLYLMAKEVLKSPVLMAAIEKLAASADPDLLKALNVTAKVVEEATDGVPYDTKEETLNPYAGTAKG